MTDLKPCPFCGGEAKLYRVGTGSQYYGNYHQMVCQGCLTASGAYWSGEQSAIDAWNTRAERTCRNISDSNYFHCSVCRKKTYRDDETFNYCPNCGAKVI